MLLGQMLSMMLMILMGFAAVKTKLVKGSQSSVISALTLYIIVPCVVIDSFQIEFSAEKMKGLLLAAGFAVLMHVLFIVVVGLLGKKWNMSPIEKASVIYSNGGNIIIPLVSALLGQEQVFYCCAFIMVQTFFFWTHTVGLIGGRSQISVKKILGNPNVIAIAIGLILFFTNTKLPGVLGDTVSSMGGIVGPVCMLMIGMIMAAADLKSVIREKLAGLCRAAAVLSGFDDTGFMDFQSYSDHSLCKRCAAHSVSGNRSSGGSNGNPDGKSVS